ncbi:Hpt domain-containing protein [Mycetocola tolaasinivorans]|uniref:Hpt domain-containing protein n=1 Tax=Mycetocola tolaasinivorans TaxID=76635 RepID=A0A3L7A2L3_9MICO|nr:Hpt domain-containing protein [Mycetocola tolaasinivorans]RLP74536.1 Hpt domain-containing protein [Mycetocola tolaasinivorans]
MSISPEERPLLEHAEIRRLCDALNGDRAACRLFLQSFCDRWAERLAALEQSLLHADVMHARDSILSIRTSSAMVGAQRLTQIASTIETTLTAGHTDEIGEPLRALRLCGVETVAALRAFMVEQAAAHAAATH